MGEEAPMAAWRAPAINPAMQSASSSSTRKDSRGALGMPVAVEIGGEALRGCRHARIFGKMRAVGGIVIGEGKRPGALRSNGHRLDVEAAERSRRENGIVKKIDVVDPLDRHHRLGGSMRHHGKLAIAPDPHI